MIKTPKVSEKERKDFIGKLYVDIPEKTAKVINEALGGVLFIDEAYSLTPKADPKDPGHEVMTQLLTAMVEHKDDLVVVFAGYKDEMREFADSNPGIRSRIGFTFNFPDYSVSDLVKMFKQKINDSGLELTKDAENAVKRIMEYFSGAQDFGNGRFVEKVFDMAINRRAKRPYDENEHKTITEADIPTTEELIGDAGMSKPKVNEKDIVWPKGVKETLDNFEIRTKYIRALAKQNLSVPAPNLHMSFEGNPGSGKTMIAQLVADILYRNGVLKSNNFVSVERKDLISNHVGETAIKTADVIKKAMNGVLFIDEAYSLTPSNGDNLGEEAIATLITAMETYKDRLVVIFAGYKEDMKRFRASNPGIDSRIGYTFEFPDYGTNELWKIFLKKTSKYKIKWDKNNKDVETNVKELMTYFKDLHGFGNGRFVDKVIDMIIDKRAQRFAKLGLDENSGLDDETKADLNVITVDDIPSIEEMTAINSNKDTMVNDSKLNDNERWRVAVHEAGHALVSHILDPDSKLVRITMNANAISMGHVKYAPGTTVTKTESEHKSILARLFGGRNAERLVFGEHADGCSSDMEKARNLAKYMIETVAMGEIGVTTETDLLREADVTATKVLSQYREQLIEIAKILWDKKTLTGSELKKVMSKKHSEPQE